MTRSARWARGTSRSRRRRWPRLRGRLGRAADTRATRARRRRAGESRRCARSARRRGECCIAGGAVPSPKISGVPRAASMGTRYGTPAPALCSPTPAPARRLSPGKTARRGRAFAAVSWLWSAPSRGRALAVPARPGPSRRRRRPPPASWRNAVSRRSRATARSRPSVVPERVACPRGASCTLVSKLCRSRGRPSARTKTRPRRGRWQALGDDTVVEAQQPARGATRRDHRADRVGVGFEAEVRVHARWPSRRRGRCEPGQNRVPSSSGAMSTSGTNTFTSGASPSAWKFVVPRPAARRRPPT